VQTVLYPITKAILPRLTTCAFSNAENWEHFLWSTQYFDNFWQTNTEV